MTEPPPVRLRLDKNRPGPLIPSALETYRALREDGGENGKRVKTVLERLRSDAPSFGQTSTPSGYSVWHLGQAGKASPA